MNESLTLGLDGGHGEPDPGAEGCGLQEYKVAMDIVQKVKPIIERHGVKVVLTRTNDKIVALNERCRIANAANANLFVSIHLNAANTQAHGYETLTYKQRPEATVMHAEMMNYLRPFGVTDRGIKERPGLAVLVGTHMPALLLENLFIDNENDMKLMKQPTFFNGLCEAIAKGILRILGVTYKPMNPAETEVPKPGTKVPTMANEVTIECNGRQLKGIAVGGRSYAPARELAELLGKKVEWIQETKTVKITD